MKKKIIGMIHLDYLEGQPQYKGLDFVVKKALSDLNILQDGGVDAVIVENWKDNTYGPFVSNNTIDCMLEVTKEICKKSKIAVGINVLPNDYRAAFYIAEQCNLSFIQLDVISDNVKTDYSYSDAKTFEINVDIDDFKKVRAKYGCEKVKVLASVQPKHYQIIDKAWTLEKSVKKAIEAGVDSIVITGIVTGVKPDIEKVKILKKIAPNTELYIGSGLTEDNFKEYLNLVNGAIVGTAFKTKDFEEVDIDKVNSFMKKVKKEY